MPTMSTSVSTWLLTIENGWPSAVMTPSTTGIASVTPARQVTTSNQRRK